MTQPATETRQLGIRISAERYEAIKLIAEAERRSVTKQIEWFIDQALAQSEAAPAPQEAPASAPAAPA